MTAPKPPGECPYCSEQLTAFHSHTFPVDTPPAAKEPEEVASSVFNRGCNCDGVDIGVGTMHEPRCGTPTPEDVADLIRAEREKLNRIVGIVQKLQPGGSPPPGDAEMLVDWIVREQQNAVAQARETALEDAAIRVIEEFASWLSQDDDLTPSQRIYVMSGCSQSVKRALRAEGK